MSNGDIRKSAIMVFSTEAITGTYTFTWVDKEIECNEITDILALNLLKMGHRIVVYKRYCIMIFIHTMMVILYV